MEFLSTYIAYNRWYRRIIHRRNDAETIRLLQRRYVIWKDYVNGRCLTAIAEPCARLTGHVHDWQALIRRWYEVRCRLVHGEVVTDDEVEHCHRSLQLFMVEIHKRHDKLQALDDWRRYVYAPQEWEVDMISVKTLQKLFTN